jgi:ketosteroid isomerase-like protein
MEMSQHNVEIVREVMSMADAALNSDPGESLEDLTQRLDKLVATDAQIDMSRRVFNPDVYQGRAGLLRLLEEIREVWDEFRVTPERFVDAGDRVVVVENIRGRGKTSGVQVEARSASIWTLRDDRVVHMQTRYQPQEALEAVGLGEQG